MLCLAVIASAKVSDMFVRLDAHLSLDEYKHKPEVFGMQYFRQFPVCLSSENVTYEKDQKHCVTYQC